MTDFEHERLDVYRASIDFVAAANEIATALPKGRAYLVDQLRRAALSISLNIAEGAGEFSLTAMVLRLQVSGSGSEAGSGSRSASP